MKIICTGYAQVLGHLQSQEAIQTYQHSNFGGFQKLRIKLYINPKIIFIPYFSFNIKILLLKLIFFSQGIDRKNLFLYISSDISVRKSASTVHFKKAAKKKREQKKIEKVKRCQPLKA